MEKIIINMDDVKKLSSSEEGILTLLKDGKTTKTTAISLLNEIGTDSAKRLAEDLSNDTNNEKYRVPTGPSRGDDLIIKNTLPIDLVKSGMVSNLSKLSLFEEGVEDIKDENIIDIFNTEPSLLKMPYTTYTNILERDEKFIEKMEILQNVSGIKKALSADDIIADYRSGKETSLSSSLETHIKTAQEIYRTNGVNISRTEMFVILHFAQDNKKGFDYEVMKNVLRPNHIGSDVLRKTLYMAVFHEAWGENK